MRSALWILPISLCLAPLAVSAQPGAAPDPAPVRDTPFPDVPRDHWAFDAVEQLRQRGIVRGYPPQGTFKPANRRSVVRKSHPGRKGPRRKA